VEKIQRLAADRFSTQISLFAMEKLSSDRPLSSKKTKNGMDIA
jgi:hypothetical protein